MSRQKAYDNQAFQGYPKYLGVKLDTIFGGLALPSLTQTPPMLII